MDQGDRYDLSFRTRSDASDVRERRAPGGERPPAKFSFRRFADQRRGANKQEMEGDDEDDDAGDSDEATEPSLSVADRLLLQPGGESARELCSGARELMARGLPGGALELFDRAITQDNSTYDAWYGRATALLEIASVPGSALLCAERVSDVESALHAALSLKPNHQDSLCLCVPPHTTTCETTALFKARLDCMHPSATRAR